jgi:outer membrane protein OmpA-like peptidoglycan-associated protein
MRRNLTIASFAFAVLAAACSSGPPPREIAEARLAVQDAKNANADQVAAREYDSALVHLRMAENTWSASKDAPAAAHWARMAEATARQAQYHAEARNAEEALRRETERKRLGEIAVRDAEIAALQARARTDAERRAAEAEIRALADRRAADERLAAQEAAAREREQARADLEARLAAERAAAERRKLEEERKAQEAHAAELARLQAEQQKTQEQLQQTLSQLATVRREARGLIVTLPGSIYFDVNKSDVKPAMRARLTEIAKALATVPNQRVLVEGHTDSDGSGEYNLQLSRLRADSVRSVLLAGGVSPERIESQGYGETRPVGTNATTAGKAQNRRVEIVIEGSAAAAP